MEVATEEMRRMMGSVKTIQVYLDDKAREVAATAEEVKSMLTRQDVAQKLIDYLDHHISLTELVDWAERAMMEEDLDERDVSVLRDLLARLGLGDVPAFALTWEDCRNYLSSLGYRVGGDCH